MVAMAETNVAEVERWASALGGAALAARRCGGQLGSGQIANPSDDPHDVNPAHRRCARRVAAPVGASPTAHTPPSCCRNQLAAVLL